MAEITPNDNDELFDDKEVGGGFINLAAHAKNKKKFLSQVQEVLNDYNVTIINIDNIRLEKDGLLSIEMDASWKNVYLGSLHTYPKSK